MPSPTLKFVQSATHDPIPTEPEFTQGTFDDFSNRYNLYIADKYQAGYTIGKTFDEPDEESLVGVRLVTAISDGTEVWIYPQGKKNQ